MSTTRGSRFEQRGRQCHGNLGGSGEENHFDLLLADGLRRTGDTGVRAATARARGLGGVGAMFQKPRLGGRMAVENGDQFSPAVAPESDNARTSSHLTVYSPL